MVFPLLWLIGVAAGLQPTVARGGTLFKEEANVAFSESSWTFVSPLSLDLAGPTVDKLRSWLATQIDVATTVSDSSPFNARMARHIHSRVEPLQTDLYRTEGRIR